MAGLPLTWTELSENELEHLRASFPLGSDGVPLMGADLVMYSNGVPMPRAYTTIADRVYNFKCRPGDVWVVTYPKVNEHSKRVCYVFKTRLDQQYLEEIFALLHFWLKENNWL